MPDAGFPIEIVTGVPVVSTCEQTGVTSAARLRAVLLSSAARPALGHSPAGTSEPRPEPGRCARGGPVARRVPASFGPKISCRTGQALGVRSPREPAGDFAARRRTRERRAVFADMGGIV